MEQDQFPDRPAQFQPSNLSTRENEAEFYRDDQDVDRDYEVAEDINMELSSQQVLPSSQQP
jgi:hypothetical protein